MLSEMDSMYVYIVYVRLEKALNIHSLLHAIFKRFHLFGRLLESASNSKISNFGIEKN